MKAVKIRNSKGCKAEAPVLNRVCMELTARFEKAGFISDAVVTDQGGIRIGLHMRSFTINTAKLGHNYDTSPYARKACKTGYRRTNTPTWEQREKYNHIINDVFDKFGLKANIYNSFVHIRYSDSGRVYHWNHALLANGERCYYEIQSKKDMGL